MKNILVLLLCLGLNGCATMSISQATALNRGNLLKLNIGVNRNEVVNIMGNQSVAARYINSWGIPTDLTINNPYRSEILQGKDKVFEVIYYVTDDKNNDGAISDDELTPLVFDNGKLIGWGWSFLQENIQKYEIRWR